MGFEVTDQIEHRYGDIAQLLHWLIAIMIFVMFGLGWYMTDLETSAQKFALYQIHKGIGVAILGLAVLRLLWRLTHPAPPLPATMAGWERLAASGTHWVLYALIFAQPLIGILQSNAANFPIVLWGSIQLPALIGQNKALEETLLELHHLGATVMAALILAHAAAALRHHLMLKDDVLRRMIPNAAIGTGIAVLAIGLVGPFFVTTDRGAAPASQTTVVENTASKVENTPAEVDNTGGGVVNVDSSGEAGSGKEESQAGSDATPSAEAPDQEEAGEAAERQPTASEQDLPADAWLVGEGSALGFLARQQGSPVPGKFERFDARIVFDPEDLDASEISVGIDVTSISTGHSDRDKTLNSASFFDTEKWPSASFKTKSITEAGEGRYEAVADLTMRDVTKEVTLPFTLTIEDDPNDPAREVAEAKGELPILRLDYGIGQGDWASTTSVADEVVITVDIKASRAK